MVAFRRMEDKKEERELTRDSPLEVLQGYVSFVFIAAGLLLLLVSSSSSRICKCGPIQR